MPRQNSKPIEVIKSLGIPDDGKVNIKCFGCGKSKKGVKKWHLDPEDAVLILMNYCPRCDTGGCFEESFYYDKDGNEIKA